jgi:hypothetical protein
MLASSTWFVVTHQASSAAIFGYIGSTGSLGFLLYCVLRLDYGRYPSVRFAGIVIAVSWVCFSLVPLFTHAALAPWGVDRHKHCFWELLHVH